ncbi:MAG: hypothetical protein WC028_30405 [Candidatus Obscuribacterales bacterium]
MQLKGRASGTKVDLNGDRMSREALVQAAKLTNEPEAAVASILDHDYTLVPYGKSISAWVVDLDDGESALDFTSESFEYERHIGLLGRTDLVIQTTSDNRPFKFVTNVKFPDSLIECEAEERNFDSTESAQRFETALNIEAECKLRLKIDKAFVPLPDILIYVGVLYIHKVISKAFDNAAASHAENLKKELISLGTLTEPARNKIANFSNATVRAWAKFANSSDRPPQFRHRLESDPTIELVYKGTDFEWASLGFSEDSLSYVFEIAGILRDEADANFVQFIFNDKCQWQLNYATTKKGNIVASEADIKKRDDYFEKMQEIAKQHGRDVGTSISFRSPDSR